jgi:hypothetical protein
MEARFDGAHGHSFGVGDVPERHAAEVVHQHGPALFLWEAQHRPFQGSFLLPVMNAAYHVVVTAGLTGIGNHREGWPGFPGAVAVDEMAVGDGDDPGSQLGGALGVEASQVADHFLPDLLVCVLGFWVQTAAQRPHPRTVTVQKSAIGLRVSREGCSEQIVLGAQLTLREHIAVPAKRYHQGLHGRGALGVPEVLLFPG